MRASWRVLWLGRAVWLGGGVRRVGWRSGRGLRGVRVSEAGARREPVGVGRGLEEDGGRKADAGRVPDLCARVRERKREREGGRVWGKGGSEREGGREGERETRVK